MHLSERIFSAPDRLEIGLLAALVGREPLAPDAVTDGLVLRLRVHPQKDLGVQLDVHPGRKVESRLQ